VLGDTRVDVFRSKDFVRVLRAATPPFLAALVPLPDGPTDAAKRTEAQIMALGVRARACGAARVTPRRALPCLARGAGGGGKQGSAGVASCTRCDSAG
jgi:hypothetical protein